MIKNVFTLDELNDLEYKQLKALADYLGISGRTKKELVWKVFEEMKKEEEENYPVKEEPRYSVRIQRIIDSQRKEN